MPFAFFRSALCLLAMLQLTAPASLEHFSAEPIGHSLRQQPLYAYRVGSGDIPLVIVATIHAGYEANTADAAWGILRHFADSPECLDPGLTLYVIPNMNPDGNDRGTRHNARKVDLNRNWDTPDWQKDIQGIWSLLRGEGGNAPFSEPETSALRDFLLRIQRLHPYYRTTAIFLHSLRMDQTSSVRSPRGLVQPAYRGEGNDRQLQALSRHLADIFAKVAGYKRIDSWVGTYPTPGEAIHWAAGHNMIAFDLEFPTSGDLTPAVPDGNPHYSDFYSGIQALMQALPEHAVLQGVSRRNSQSLAVK